MEIEDLSPVRGAVADAGPREYSVTDLKRLDRSHQLRLRLRLWRTSRDLVWLWIAWVGTAVFVDLSRSHWFLTAGINVAVTVAMFWLMQRSLRAVAEAPGAVDVASALDLALHRVTLWIEVWKQGAWVLSVVILALLFFDNHPLHGAFPLRVSLAAYAVPLLGICVKHARGYLATEARDLQREILSLRGGA